MRLYQLLEYDRQKEMTKAGQKLLSAIEHDALFKDETANLSDEEKLSLVFDKFDEIDPTPMNKFVPWLIREYSNGRMFMSDVPEMEHYLSLFKTLAPRLKNSGVSVDLNQYKRHDLIQMLDNATETKTDKADSSIEDMLSEVDPNEMEILYKGPWGLLVRPKTEEASCILGHGTRWCTAATEYENQFNYYANAGYDLYIWRGKGGVAQFSFGSMEFMDQDDKPLSKERLDYFRNENPITAKLFKREERRILKDPQLAYRYAEYVIQGRFKEAEPYIMKDLEMAYKYARDVIQGRFKEAEPYIMKDPEWAYRYAEYVIQGRFKEAEPYIMKDPKLAYWYALYIIKGRWKEAEKYIMKDPKWAYWYATYAIKGRWPEAEPIIAKDPQAAYTYAKHVIKGRWKEAEPHNKKDPEWAYDYAIGVIKGRWPEAEPIIAKDPEWAYDYARHFGIDVSDMKT